MYTGGAPVSNPRAVGDSAHEAPNQRYSPCCSPIRAGLEPTRGGGLWPQKADWHLKPINSNTRTDLYTRPPVK